MRLVALVVCCLVLVQGSSSLLGFGRRKEERLQRKLSGVVLNKQLRKGYAPTTQAPVTNVNIQNIYHDSDTNVVEKSNNIGTINNNIVNTKANINQKSNNYLNNNLATYNRDETETVSNNYYGEVPHSRRKRETVIKNGNTTTYKYVAQPGRSRFTYLKKVQHLPEPEPEPEPKIEAVAVQKSTSVKEEHMHLTEEDHEEVHEEHIQTTKHSKKSSKHKKKSKSSSRRKSRRRSRKEKKSSVTDIEESNINTNQEIIQHIKKVKTTNVTESDEVSKKQKSTETKVKEPNLTTVDRSNKTENSLAKKRNEVSKTELGDSTGLSIVNKKELNESEDLLESGYNRTTYKKTRQLDVPVNVSSQPVVIQQGQPSVGRPTPVVVAQSLPSPVKAPKRQRSKAKEDKPPRGSRVLTGDSQRRPSVKGSEVSRRPIVTTMNVPQRPPGTQRPSAFSSPRLHLDTGLRGSLDIVPLGKREGAPAWGVPMANAAGKLEYLSVGGGRGDIHFVPRTDSRGHTEFLYPTVDDAGRSHNIHLRTQQGHLTLVETDFQNGARSSGFLGYDNYGEYVVPVHFEQGHHLVVEPRAHSLQYAVDVHPAYETITQVFHYQR